MTHWLPSERTCQAFGTAKTSLALSWKALCKTSAAKENACPPEVKEWAATFHDALANPKNDAKKDISSWSLTSTPARSVVLRNMIATLETVATEAAVHIHAMEERVKQANQAESGGLRKAQAERH